MANSCGCNNHESATESMLKYKEVAEKFVSGYSGGGMTEIIGLYGVVWLSYLLRSLVWSILVKWRNPLTVTTDKSVTPCSHARRLREIRGMGYCFDFLLLILPCLLAHTVTSNALDVNLAVLAGLAALLMIYSLQKQQQQQQTPLFRSLSGLLFDSAVLTNGTQPKTANTAHHKARSLSEEESDQSTLAFLNSARPLFLSDFRAAVMLTTCMAILAVDFTIFPRRFIKTETFGTSVMDMGVGAFLVSAGLSSPLVRQFANLSSDCGSSGIGGGKGGGKEEKGEKGEKGVWRKLIASVFPLIVLGGARLFTVKASNYQEHVSEYGVHWNFFFSLAFVKLWSQLVVGPVVTWACVALASHRVHDTTSKQRRSTHSPLSSLSFLSSLTLSSCSVLLLLLSAIFLSASHQWFLSGKFSGQSQLFPSSSMSTTRGGLFSGFFSNVISGLTSGYDMTDFILHGSRDGSFSLLRANKEGLCSAWGFLAIYLCSVALGVFLKHKPSSSSSSSSSSFSSRRDDDDDKKGARRNNKMKMKTEGKALAASTGGRSLEQWFSCLRQLFCLDIFLWILTYLLSEYVQTPSRRMANATYVCWILAQCVLCIVGFLFTHLWLVPSSNTTSCTSSVPSSVSSSFRSSTSSPISREEAEEEEAVLVESAQSSLISGVNRNQLALFLFANICTGAVNKSMYTIYASPGTALCVLVGYLLIISSMCQFWQYKKFTIKL